MTDTLYIPPDAKKVDTIHAAQFRLGIQGKPGEGKTQGASTFPHCLFGNVDRGLGGIFGENVIEIPFYSPEWCKSMKVTWKPGEAINRRDAIMDWCRKELPKLSSLQTFVMDTVGGLESAFDIEEAKYPVYTKGGELDKFAPWRHKLEWFQEMFEDIFKSASCNIICIFHEQMERNSQGDLTGKNVPLFTGQFKDKILGHLTDHFRQHCIAKKPLEKVDEKVLKAWGMKSKEEFLAMQNTFIGDAVYCWQTEGDDIFSAKKSSLKPGTPKFIPSNYESFMKWRKPVT